MATNPQQAILKLENGDILALDTLQDATLNLGVEETEFNLRNEASELTFSEFVVNAFKPTLNLTYARLTKEMWALKTGYRLQGDQTITDATYAFSKLISGNRPAVTVTSSYGNAIALDEPGATASYINEQGVSTPLSREPWVADTPPAGPEQYSVGANAEVLFSPDIIALRPWVTFVAPFATGATAVNLGTQYGFFDVTLLGTLQEKGIKKMFEIRFPFMQLNRTDNSEIPMAADSQTLNFRDLSGSCKPNIIFHNLDVFC